MLILWIEMRRSGILRQFLWSGTSRLARDNEPVKKRDRPLIVTIAHQFNCGLQRFPR